MFFVYRLRHWGARYLCGIGRHNYETRGNWSKCVRIHWYPHEADRRGTDYLCYKDGK